MHVGHAESATITSGERDARARRAVDGVAVALGLLTLCALAWGVAQAFVRPPDYAEGCLVFNAARIRAGLPLYVDPIVGAHEYGEPPARYFVAYTPIAASWLALLPTKYALIVGRLVGLSAWFAALGHAVSNAKPDCRRIARVAALFAGSMFLFVLGSATVKPDAVALLLASIALGRTLDSGCADARSGFLFGVAALIKQSVIGIALGAIGASLFVGGERRFRGIAAAGVVVASVLAVLEIASGGMAIHHMRAALGLVFVPRLAAENVASRAPFIAGLIAMAAMASAQARAISPRAHLARASLASAVLVACIGFGKVGAASNYLMESALTGVVVLSRLPLSLPRTLIARVALWGAIALTLPWATVATVRSLADAWSNFGTDRAALRRIGQRCIDRQGAVVLSTDPGVEFVINGRIHTHHIELWNEVERGRFPAAIWASDARHPNVRCVVTRYVGAVPPAAPAALFPEEVLATMREHFAFAGTEGVFALYTRQQKEP